MPRVIRAAVGLLLVAALPAAPSHATQSGASADGQGGIYRYDLESLKRVASLDGPAAGGEFATSVADNFIATAPGAEGGGAVLFWSDAGVLSSVSAADLSERPTARLGEDWDDLGHPPGISNAMVVGAPGEIATPSSRAIRPAVLIVEYGNGRILREERRVTGKGGSLFGWRLAVMDSQFPEASYNASWLASAPLEGKGKKRRAAGAVYKYDTVTGRRIWRFAGERAGELAGYAMTRIQDVDGDGVDDVLVGAPGAVDRDPAGRVYVLSGATGVVIARIEAPEEAVLFGATLAQGYAFSALEGVLVGAPGTPRGRKDAAGAVYVYSDLTGEPDVFRGKRPDQWFGVALTLGMEHLYVGSFEGSRNVNKDRRGSVTVMLGSGKTAKVIRGRRGGDYFGREIAIGAALAVGAPGAPPLYFPE